MTERDGRPVVTHRGNNTSEWQRSGIYSNRSFCDCLTCLDGLSHLCVRESFELETHGARTNVRHSGTRFYVMSSFEIENPKLESLL